MDRIVEDSVSNSQHSPIRLVKSLSSPSFRVIRRASPYIDKSFLLKALFDPSASLFGSPDDDKWQRIVVITAPRSFGKSVNLDMIKCFIEIQVDVKTGAHVPKYGMDSNYTLFEGLQIMKDIDFVNQFFGKRPVLKVDFFGTIKNVNNNSALEFCRSVMYKAFLEHEYLTHSEYLNDHEKNVCTEWCDEKKHKKKNFGDTTSALVELSTYLHKHYQRKVFILVDEFDSLPLKSVFKTSKKDLEDITDLVIDIIAPALRFNSECVVGGILTGISNFSGIGLSVDLKLNCSFRFLYMGRLDKYYGLTEAEAKELLDGFNCTEDEKKSIQNAYKGYLTKTGLSIYNIWSVIQHLKAVQEHKYDVMKNKAVQNNVCGSAVKPQNYWLESDEIPGIKGAYKFCYIRKLLSNVVQGEPIFAVIYPQIEKYHLECMRRLVCEEPILEEKEEYYPDSNLFITFLLEHGCFSFLKRDETRISDTIRIPNMEVWQAMARDLSQCYVAVHGISESHLKSCSISFNELFLAVSSDEKFQQKLTKLKSALQECCLPLIKLSTDTRLEILRELLFHSLFSTGYSFYSYFLWYKEGFAIIIKLENTDGAKQGLKEILNWQLYSQFENKDIFPEAITEYILMGLDFNPDLKVSMCCLRKKEFHSHQISLEKQPRQKLTNDKIEELIKVALLVESEG